MTKSRNRTTASAFGLADNPFMKAFAQNPFMAVMPGSGLAAGSPPPAGSLMPLELLAGGHGQAARAWLQLSRALLEGMGKLQQESSRFVVRRLEEDLERQQQLLACRSPEDAWQVLADYARQTVQDYSDEAGRLSEIAAETQYACSGFGEMLAAGVVDPDARKAA